jgi:hypothetical protein
MLAGFVLMVSIDLGMYILPRCAEVQAWFAGKGSKCILVRRMGLESDLSK